jgi:hypothetical protein
VPLGAGLAGLLLLVMHLAAAMQSVQSFGRLALPCFFLSSRSGMIVRRP